MKKARIITRLLSRIRGSHAAHLMDHEEIEAIMPVLEKRISEANFATAKWLNVGPHGKVELSIILSVAPYELQQ